MAKYKRYKKKNPLKGVLIIIFVLSLFNKDAKTISLLLIGFLVTFGLWVIVRNIFTFIKSTKKDKMKHNQNASNIHNKINKTRYERQTEMLSTSVSNIKTEFDNYDENIEVNDNDRTFGYQTSKSIATETEKAFYDKLKLYCKERDLIVNLKTRLEDLVVYAKGMDYATKQKYRGQIKSRHVDYLIVNDDLVPVFAIELDDASHSKKKAMETDAFKDSFFNKIGIKLYRIAADDFYWKLELEKVFIEYDELYNSRNISNPL